jgi:hypothetical protein
MFAILVPISLAPLILTLLWAERKAKRLGLVPTPSSSDQNPDSGTPLTPLDPHPHSSPATHAEGYINGTGAGNGAPLDYGSTGSPTKQSFSPPPAATAAAGRKSKTKTILSRIWKIGEQLDVIGLMLLGGGVACILLPLTLAEAAKGGWRNREFVL